MSDTKHVVLIHGAWCSGDSWGPARAVFEERGYTVHTPTLRHHELPLQEGAIKIAPLNMRDYTDDLVALVNWTAGTGGTGGLLGTPGNKGKIQPAASMWVAMLTLVRLKSSSTGRCHTHHRRMLRRKQEVVTAACSSYTNFHAGTLETQVAQSI
jgi:hypothetical protein